MYFKYIHKTNKIIGTKQFYMENIAIQKHKNIIFFRQLCTDI